MTLSDEAKERLTDIVSLQPTKNSELQDRWGMDSGSEIHQYLESELKEYYYRDENSLIRATPEAAELVGLASDEDVISVPALQSCILDVIAGPDAAPESVVSVLHDIRETDADLDPTVDEVRSALRKLQDRGLVSVVQKTVPTFRLAVERDTIAIEVLD
jgi:chromosome condensin MukBEF MukE localization factor